MCPSTGKPLESKKKLNKIMTPFYRWGSTASVLQSYYEETVYFLPFSSKEFLVFNWSTSEGWKAEITLEPPSGFELRTPGLGIQRFKH